MSIDEQPTSPALPAFAEFAADRIRVAHTAAAAGAVIGTLMPWVSVFFVKVNGTDVDGGLPFWAALAILAVAIFGSRIPWVWVYRVLAVGLPLYLAGEAVYVISQASTASTDENEFFEIGVSLQPGLFITLAAAVACIVVTVMGIQRDRAARG